MISRDEVERWASKPWHEDFGVMAAGFSARTDEEWRQRERAFNRACRGLRRHIRDAKRDPYSGVELRPEPFPMLGDPDLGFAIKRLFELMGDNPLFADGARSREAAGRKLVALAEVASTYIRRGTSVDDDGLTSL